MNCTLSVTSPSFQAVWNEGNECLKEVPKTIATKAAELAWNVFSLIVIPIGAARALGWVVHFIAKKIVLPAAWFYPKQTIKQSKKIFKLWCQNLNQFFAIQNHVIQTPDGVHLNAIHFKHHLAREKDPTILFYQSNASMSQFGIYLWLVEEAIRRGSVCNFVVFDYRGVGNSKGDAESARELLIDGDTALQFVRNHLNVPPHLIHWYGWSLGGGVGANIKANHPECDGPFVNERSFESLRSVFYENIPSLLQPLFFWLPWAADKKGWNIKAPLEKIRGKTLIVFHPDDPTIPYAASAQKAAIQTNLKVQSMQLYQTPEQINRAKERFVDHHFEELSHYQASADTTADKAIADFILPLPSSTEMK